MSKKSYTVPVADVESPDHRDDQKLLGSPFDKLPPIMIGGPEGNGYHPFQQKGSPVTPTTPIVYAPRSPSLGKRYVLVGGMGRCSKVPWCSTKTVCYDDQAGGA